MRITARVAAVAAAILVASGLAPVSDAAAAASALPSSCPGTLKKTFSIPEGTKSYGNLYIYWDSATQRNCAKTVKFDTSKQQQFWVGIFRCSRPNADTPQECDTAEDAIQGRNYDDGNYWTYAGAVTTLGNSSGVCIYVAAEIELQRAARYARRDWVGLCG